MAKAKHLASSKPQQLFFGPSIGKRWRGVLIERDPGWILRVRMCGSEGFLFFIIF